MCSYPSAMTATSKFRSTWRRQAAGSRSAAFLIAAGRSAGSSRMNPVTPSATTSGTEPRFSATTGVPQAMASIITMPNGSSPRAGDIRQGARPARLRFGHPPGQLLLGPPVRLTDEADALAQPGRYLSPEVRQFGRLLELAGQQDGPPSRAGRVDSQVSALVRAEPAEEEHIVVLVRPERELGHADCVVDGATPGHLRPEPPLSIRDSHQVHVRRDFLVKRADFTGDRAVRGDHGRRLPAPRGQRTGQRVVVDDVHVQLIEVAARPGRVHDLWQRLAEPP